MVRDSLRSVLNGYRNLDIVGEAGDGEEAIQMVTNVRPNLIIMDINLPKIDGISATRYIKTHHPEIAVIGLSLILQSYSEYAMKKAGAFEVVDKDKIMTELYGAMQRAVASIQPVLILQDTQVRETPCDSSEQVSASDLAKDEER
jgi:DNA-binding NarL/FixJ family response regulator